MTAAIFTVVILAITAAPAGAAFSAPGLLPSAPAEAQQSATQEPPADEPAPVGQTEPPAIPESIARYLAGFTAPRNALRAYLTGRRRAVRGRLPRARRLFEKAVAYYPNYASAWADLGRVYQAIGDTPRALDAYRKALALDPEVWRAHAGLAELAAARGDWVEAARESERALQIMPSADSRVFVVNAMAKYALGDLAGARWSAEKALERAWVGADPEAYFVLGLIDARQGRYRQAAANLKLYLTLEPDGEDVRDARKQLAWVEEQIRKETGEQPEFIRHPSGMLVKNAAYPGSKR